MDLDRLWKNTQEELRVVLAPAVFQTFVSKTILIALDGDQALIGCPNSYLADINRRRYLPLFQSALDHQTGTSHQLQFIVQDSLSTEPTSPPPPLFTPPTTPSTNTSSPLNSRYTFSNLVVGNSNNFAFAAAQGIIEHPGSLHNPFFIWGGVGVGKTHLMQAIGHELLRLRPETKIRYLPAETFGNDLINSLRTKTITQFKQKYRQIDCLLIDDIQFIAGKEYIQEEFFHTFNSLHLDSKQVILTSDRKPQDIHELEDRLVSRFSGGLTVDIQPPDFEMRQAIINQYLDNHQFTATPAIVSSLAAQLPTNIRDIEGQLQQLLVRARASHLTSFTTDFIDQTFSSPRPKSTPAVTPRHCLSVCSRFFRLKTSDLLGASRRQDIVTARHFTAYLLTTDLRLSLEEVGRLLGHRDHTSIMHARDKIQAKLSTDATSQQTYHQLRQLLNS